MRIIGIYVAAGALFAACWGCGVDIPGKPDGRAALVVTVADTSGFLPGSVPGERYLVDSAEVRVESRTHIFTAVQMTGPDGVVAFDHLDTGIYSIVATRTVKLGSANKVFTGTYKVEMQGEVTVVDTVDVTLVSSSQLMINEIYYAGSCASMFYMYDLFVELANTSDDTLYLDGMLVIRADNEITPEIETYDYVKGIFAFQFPGAPVTGRQYPIYPKQLVVLASDATNHAQFCATSIDLRNADWEMFNALGHDFDNPAVPNLENIMPGKSADFLIGMTHNGVFLTTGDEFTFDSENQVLVPIGNVIDGVEYSVNGQATKQITVRVDAGLTGVGLMRYSSASIERREFGLDTNDSTFDFTVLARSTPGYFHGE